MPESNQGNQVQKSTVKGWYGDGKKFTVTHYSYAVEDDPFYAAHDQSDLVEVPELDNRKFTRGFLGIDKNGAVLPAKKNVGVTMQGSGQTSKGDYIMYVKGGKKKGSKAKFKYGRGGKFAQVTRPYEQIAVDPKVISKGSKVYVELYDRVMSADDIGSKIKGKHIDIFVGAKTYGEVKKLSGKKSSRLGIVDKKTATGGADIPTKAPAQKKEQIKKEQPKNAKVHKDGALHTISRGETLASIAKDYDVPGGYKALAEYNGIANPKLLHVGQEIVIPAKGNVSVKAPRPAMAPNPKAVQAPSGLFEHTVAKGETLAAIAKQYKVPGGYRAIVNANNLRNPNSLHIGQKLRIPKD